MQKFSLLIGMILIGFKMLACDVCGCAASSFSLGLLPSSNHHFIGFRSSIRSFSTTHPSTFGVQEPPSREVFSTNEIMGRWKINHRFQLIGIVPYISNIQESQQVTTKMNGLGDITLLGNYVFIQNTDSLVRQFKQAGTIGIGSKLPTGFSDNSTLSNRNMLPGTGSYDFLFTVNYSIQKGVLGYLTETSFNLKTKNKANYQFGNALSTSHLFFYRWAINENIRVIPQVGINYNFNFRDAQNGKITNDSYNGGSIVNAQFSVATICKNWMISAHYFAPLTQQLGNGYVTQRAAFRFSINYFIRKK